MFVRSVNKEEEVIIILKDMKIQALCGIVLVQILLRKLMSTLLYHWFIYV